MTTAALRTSAPADAAGYWTIQLVLHAGSKSGHTHLCHAAGQPQAKAMASKLCGATRTSAGFDLYQIDLPKGVAEVPLGATQPIGDPKTWAALTAARRAI